MASGVQTRIDKLKTREFKLTQDLGRVRGELAAAKNELEKLRAAGAATTDAPSHEVDRAPH